MRVLIVGAGGHGEVVADALLASSEAGRADCTLVGFLDDDPGLHGREVIGYPVLGALDALSRVPHEALVVAVGDNLARSRLLEQLAQLGERLLTVLHPSATVARGVTIGHGSVVCAGAVVNPGAALGRGVIVNTSASVDHHSVVGDYTHLAPGCHTGGEVRIAQGVLVGIGASVLPRRRIGEWAVIGAGAVVTEDVHAHATVVGVPARAHK